MNETVCFFCDDFPSIVKKNPGQPAIYINSIQDSSHINYTELEQLIRRSLTLFAQKGLQPGDTIAASLPNSLEAVVIFLSTIAGGFGFAPLPCTATPYEIQRWNAIVKPKLWLWTDLLTESTREHINQLSICNIKINTDLAMNWLPDEMAHWPQSDNAIKSRVYLQTSGTTGEPKAMVIDGNRLWKSGKDFIHWHNPNQTKLRFWNYLPMSYLGGLFNLLLIPIANEGSTVIDQAFSGKTFLGYWQTIERFKINAIWLVPTIVRGLLQLAQLTKRQNTTQTDILYAFLGTAPIDLATKESFEKQFGVSLLENFALSETTFISSEHYSDDKKQRIEGSTGKVLPHIRLEFKSINDSGDLNTSSKELYIKSPYNFLGYLDMDGAISLPLDEKGYLATGDMGYLDDNNQLVITGRHRDIIKKGGHLIYLREIEALALANGNIAEVAAIKVNHPFYGEAYNLFVIPKTNTSINAIELERWLHQHLVQYKWPESVKFIESLPKTSSGKVMKHILADQVE